MHCVSEWMRLVVLAREPAAVNITGSSRMHESPSATIRNAAHITQILKFFLLTRSLFVGFSGSTPTVASCPKHLASQLSRFQA